MKVETSLAVLVAAAALAMQPAFVTGRTSSSEAHLQQRSSAQAETAHALTHKMMGHINLASVALDTLLPETAEEQVKKAEILAKQLSTSAPELQPQLRFKYGKISYTVNDQSKNYYVPILDDLFLLSDYKSTFHAWSNSADIKETDAGVVELTLSVDIRKVQEALRDAGAKIQAKRYKQAGEALTRIFEGALVDEVVFADPIWAVHDSLALAKNLIEEERYDSARYALRHAQEDIEELQKSHAGQEESESLRKMNARITRLENELEQKDTPVMDQIGDTLSAWMHTVESLFSKP